MPRLCARAAAYASSTSSPCSKSCSRELWNVLNTSWLENPSRSSARGRSAAMNDPVAAKFFRAMISDSSSARYSADACLAASRSNEATRSACCSPGSPVWRSSLPLEYANTGRRSLNAASAWSRNHVGVSMMWASASWTTRPCE